MQIDVFPQLMKKYTQNLTSLNKLKEVSYTKNII